MGLALLGLASRGWLFEASTTALNSLLLSLPAAVVAMLRKAEGATLAEIMKATGWQSHSVRGFVSGSLGKAMGLKVESNKRADGQRVYKLKT